MSQEDAPSASAVPANQDGPLTFTLSIISPSAGVTNNKIDIPLVTAAMTVKDIKAKIRDALPSKPSDESQRLIYRGRMLARENETLQDIFGQELLDDANEAKILHLVLRSAITEATAPVPGDPINGNPNVALPHLIPNPAASPQTGTIPPVEMLHLMREQQARIQRLQDSIRPPAINPMQPTQHQMLQAQLQQADQMQHSMAQRLQTLHAQTLRLNQEIAALEQRTQNSGSGANVPANAAPGANNHTHLPEGLRHLPMFQPPHLHAHGLGHGVQALIDQGQRDRAAAGLQGLPHHGAPRSGRASPNPSSDPNHLSHTNTYTREGLGPNGERWQVTVNEMTTTIPGWPPLPQQPTAFQSQLAQQANADQATAALELQSVLRSADRFARHNTQRSASNPPIRTTSSNLAPSASRPGTTGLNTTPATTTNSPAPPTLLPLNPSIPIDNPAVQPNISPSTSAATNSNPVVYLLSSSQGPRALLVTGADSFYTPRVSRRIVRGVVADGTQPFGLPEFRNRNQPLGQQPLAAAPPRTMAERRDARAAQQPGQQPAAAAQANQPAAPAAQQFNLGNMLWLIVRLAGFVWFFTTGSQSWTRWTTIILLALVVFIVNTGWLNDIANDLFGPVRRHLENLIPLAGPDAALIPAANGPVVPRVPNENAAANGNAARRAGEPTPEEAAARILEQRRQARANGGWLQIQFRRAEHAFLLFVASLVPGVGERHIAAREAEANAAQVERQRQFEAAENAAREAEGTEQAQGENEGDPAPSNPETTQQPLIETRSEAGI